MNSAQLVNLILEKFQNRVKFLHIGSDNFPHVRFIWGGNEYSAVVQPVGSSTPIVVFAWVEGEPVTNNYPGHVENYRKHVEGRLNGLVRNDAGELVQS